MKKIIVIMLILSSILLAEFIYKNGTVLDTKTTLVWQDEYIGSINNGNKKMYWSDALQYCQKLNLDGSNDWRVPNIRELSSIVDRNRHSPSISAIFEQTYSGNYWSSTTYAHSTKYAHTVNFFYGYSLHDLKENTTIRVRCVRDNIVDKNSFEFLPAVLYILLN